MRFRFFDADALGNEVLIDEHLFAGTGPVVVSGGLFNVALGSGDVVDGSGLCGWRSRPTARRCRLASPCSRRPTRSTDANPVSVGEGFCYLITAENLIAEEGTNGYSGSGAERGNPAPCP